MKKSLALFLLLLLGTIFVGCTEITTGTPTDVTSTTVSSDGTETTITTTVPATTTTMGALDYSAREIDFVNFSEEFTQVDPIDHLQFYYYNAYKNGVPYVDITEFVTMMLGLIDDTVQVDITGNTVKVWTEYFYTEEEKQQYNIEEDSFLSYVLFDFDKTQIEATNVDASDYFTGESATDYSAGIDMVSYTEEEMPLLTIDMLDYDFMFFKLVVGEETHFTIPLSIAGLFLTGANYYVINNGDTLYGVDIFQIYDVTDEESPLNAAVALNADVTPAEEQESRRFLELTFDTFYGLKDYKGIDSFKTYTNQYFESGVFEYSFTSFLDSLEDLHTGVLSYGHNNPGYYYGITPQYIYDYSYEYYGCECYKNPSNFKLSFYKDMAYLRITEFTADLNDSIAPKMAQIAEAGSKYVVIDLACNGGGFVHGVLYLLNYLTNDDISFYYDNDGAKISETYAIEGDMALDAQFYFVTSAVTYSAANLTVAVATQMDLAQTIGSKSGGGACYVKYIVLPNGAIFQMSSPTAITYSDYTTVEGGVEPDYFINFLSAGKSYYQGYSDDPDYPSLIDFYSILSKMNPAS